MFKKKLFLTFLLVIALGKACASIDIDDYMPAPPTEAQKAAAKPAAERIKKEAKHLTLKEAVALTLLNAKQVDIVELDVVRDGGEVIAFGEPFDPQMFSDVSFKERHHILKTRLYANQWQATFGLNKKARVGTVFSFNTTIDRHLNESTDPLEYASNATITFRMTQPLLRGFLYGEDTMRERASQLFLKATYFRSLLEISDRVRNTISLYWSAVAAKRRVEVQKAAVERGKDLLEKTKQLVQNQEIAKTDIVQVVTQLDQEFISLQFEEQALYNAYQKLSFYTGLDLDPKNKAWKEFVLDDFPKSELEWKDLLPLLPDVVENGLQERYDFLAQQCDIQGNKYLVKGASNATKPELNLYTEASSLNPQSGKKANTFGKILSRKNDEVDIALGAEFSLPFYNVGPKGRLQSQRAAFVQSSLGLERLKDQAISSIRQTFLDQATFSNQVILNRKQVEDNELLASNEAEKLKGGISTIFFLIDFQNRVTEAQLDLIDVEVAYWQNFTQLLYETGNLLESMRCFDNFNVITDETTWLMKVMK